MPIVCPLLLSVLDRQPAPGDEPDDPQRADAEKQRTDIIPDAGCSSYRPDHDGGDHERHVDHDGDDNAVENGRDCRVPRSAGTSDALGSAMSRTVARGGAYGFVMWPSTPDRFACRLLVSAGWAHTLSTR